MKGFKNMKKIVAVLVLALVAMTAVFAGQLGTDNLTVTLAFDGETTFGFSSNQLTETDLDLAPVGEDGVLNVTFDTDYTVYASFVSSEYSQISFSVTVPSVLTDATINKTVAVEYTETEYGYAEQAKADSKRFYSLPITFRVPYDDYVAGTYTGNMVMTVSAQ